MRKRILAFLLTGVVLFTGFPVEAAAKIMDDADSSFESSLVLEEVSGGADNLSAQESLKAFTGENGDTDVQQPSGLEPGVEQEVEAPQPKEREESSNSPEPEVDQEGDSHEAELREADAKGPQIPGSANGDSDNNNTESQQPEEDQANSESKSSSKQLSQGDAEEEQEWEYPIGGYQPVEKVKISDKMAKSIGGIEEGEMKRLYSKYQYQLSLYGSQKYDSSWDIYSSNYIYNRLSAKEREFWDRLDAICRRYLNTTANATLSTVNMGKTYYVMNEGVGYLYLGLTFRQASNLYTLFGYANPQYYFIKEGYLYTDTFLFPMVYDEFAGGDVRKAETAKVKAQIESMRKKIKKGANDVEKAKLAHDLIVEKVKYDPGFSFQNSKPYTPFHQSAYSVFCDDYTVCAGYTKSYSILMNSEGIDTIGVTSSMVTGYDEQGNEIREGHAWNAVCFNDSWYYVDLTWDDRDGKDGRSKIYTFFGMSESKMTRVLDPTGFHQKESHYAGLTPKCTKDFDSTADAIGTVYTPQKETAAPVFGQKKTKNGISVSLSCATPGAEIYYTTDGKTPASSYSRSNLYKGAFKVNANVTVKAVAVRDGNWDSPVSSASVKGKMVVVEFDTRGGANMASQKVWPGDAVKKPVNPKREGYKFAGWYQDKKYKNKWDFKRKVTKNTSIYAKWNKIKVAGTSIRRLSNLSGRKMAVVIQALSGANGYQIRYSTRVDMKSSKKKVIKSTKGTVDKLKTGVTYYVQVRAYKKDSAGEKVFGKWSGTKAVTIRK